VDESEEELQRQREDYAYDLLQKEKEQIARKLLAKNVAINIISETTGLSEEVVKCIRQCIKDADEASKEE